MKLLLMGISLLLVCVIVALSYILLEWSNNKRKKAEPVQVTVPVQVTKSVQVSRTSLGIHASAGIHAEEIVIRGGFFSEEGNEPLIVHRGQDDEIEQFEELEFYRGTQKIGEYTNYRISIFGVCRPRHTPFLSLLFQGWNGAAGIPGGLIYAKFDSPTGLARIDDIIDVLPDIIDGPKGKMFFETMGVVECDDNEEIWTDIELDGPRQEFDPCDCTYEDFQSFDEFLYTFPRMLGSGKDKLSIERFPFSFIEGETYQLSELDIDDESFTETLEYAANLDSRSGMNIHTVESSNYIVKTIGYQRGTWSSYQYIFVGKKEAGSNIDWKAVYSAYFSSKSSNVAYVIGFVSRTEIEVVMCVDDCGWWGSYGVVEIDIKDMVARFVRYAEEEDYERINTLWDKWDSIEQKLRMEDRLKDR